MEIMVRDYGEIMVDCEAISIYIVNRSMKSTYLAITIISICTFGAKNGD